MRNVLCHHFPIHPGGLISFGKSLCNIFHRVPNNKEVSEELKRFEFSREMAKHWRFINYFVTFHFTSILIDAQLKLPQHNQYDFVYKLFLELRDEQVPS